MRKKIKLLISKLLFVYFKFMKKGNLVIIVHQSRSGSTYLGNILNQSKQINYFGELFNNFPKRIMNQKNLVSYLNFPLKILKNVKFIDGSKVSCIEIIPWLQLNSHSLEWLYPDANQFLKEADKVVFIRRRNKFKLVFSLYLANRQGIYHKGVSSENESDNFSFHFDFSYPISGFLGDLNDLILFLENDDQKTLNFISQHRGLEIIYEDELNDTVIEKTVSKFIEYTDLEPFKFEVRNKKVTSRKLKDYITNYDELITYSKDKSWSWMLND